LSAVALGMRGRREPSSRSSIPCMLFATSCCTVRSRSLCWCSRCGRVREGVGADAGKGDRERERGTDGGRCWSAVRVVSRRWRQILSAVALLRPAVDRFSSAAMVLSCGALSWSSSRRVAGSRDMVQSCRNSSRGGRNSSRGGNMYDHCEGCMHVTVAVQGYATWHAMS
jgi:hypothetical protein